MKMKEHLQKQQDEEFQKYFSKDVLLSKNI